MFQYLEDIFSRALSSVGVETYTLVFDEPRNSSHGDASTNVALTLARTMGRPPRAIAQLIVDAITIEREWVDDISIAGAGFINVKLTPRYFQQRLRECVEAGQAHGRSDTNHGRRANVEYVSANPTGPLHPGHGRNIMLGDAIATILAWTGYTVTREYYFNNAGNQMNNLARSIHARYCELLGDASVAFDEENGYRGQYIYAIAQTLIEEYQHTLLDSTEENLTICRKRGESWCFASIQATLQRLGVQHDVYFNEHDLYTSGAIDGVVQQLRDRGLAYNKDGAVWIATSQLGLENDKVIVKSSGEPTYRLPDIAYHTMKCGRGDDLIIDIFGADHSATAQEVLAGVRALGYNTDRIKVVIHQMVSFLRDGVPFKLSKRSGEQYTLDDLMDDVGPDVVRFFFLMRSADTQLIFDINLALEQSEKNPVFYLQYAHARLSSIFRNADDSGIQVSTPNVDLSVLTHDAEIQLIKTIDRFPMMVQRAANTLEPHILADYLRDVAASFHRFYHECRILGADADAQQARLTLASATRQTLRNGLSVLGISAPDTM